MKYYFKGILLNREILIIHHYIMLQFSNTNVKAGGIYDDGVKESGVEGDLPCACGRDHGHAACEKSIYLYRRN